MDLSEELRARVYEAVSWRHPSSCQCRPGHSTRMRGVRLPPTRFAPAAFSRGFRPVTSGGPVLPRPVARVHPRVAALRRPSPCARALQGGWLLGIPRARRIRRWGRWGAPRGRACNVMTQKCPLFVLSAGWHLVLDQTASSLAPCTLLCQHAAGEVTPGVYRESNMTEGPQRSIAAACCDGLLIFSRWPYKTIIVYI